jgi:hypothetical protein
MFGAFIVLSVFPIGWRRKYQEEQVLVNLLAPEFYV